MRSSVMHTLFRLYHDHVSRKAKFERYPFTSAASAFRPRSGHRDVKRATCAALSVTVTAILSVSVTPTSAADPTTHLKSELDAARSQSGCAPLQSDPRLNAVSQRIAHESDDYVKHTLATLPTNGESDLLATGAGGLLPVLREAGYNTNKVRLLLGYGDSSVGGPGDNEAKAVKSAVLQGVGFEALPDCGFKKYGFSAINDDSKQGFPSTPPRTYAVSAVVLAGDG